MSDFDFSTATVQEKLDERDRRDECRRRHLSFFGPDTLPHTWRHAPVTARRAPAPDDAIAQPIDLGVRTITLPWTNLCRDNERLTPVVRGQKAIQITSKPYAAAKQQAKDTAHAQLGMQPPLDGPLRFTAVMYEPNRHRRDLGNYVKMVADALSGVCYHDDSQIAELDWRRAGIDIDAPRLVITVRQLFDKKR